MDIPVCSYGGGHNVMPDHIAFRPVVLLNAMFLTHACSYCLYAKCTIAMRYCESQSVSLCKLPRLL